jgi:oxygen-independent coproporphyrinogen-3 oxidase
MRQVTFRKSVDAALEKADTLILGLRLSEGVGLAEWRDRFDSELDADYGRPLAELEGLGLLERSDGALRLTPRGRLLANEVFQRFLPAGED